MLLKRYMRPKWSVPGLGLCYQIADTFEQILGGTVRARILMGAATTAVTVAGLLAGSAGVAAADPIKAPSVSALGHIDCGQLGSGTFFTNSGHSQALTWNPFFVIDSVGGLTTIDPTAFDFTVSVNGVPVFSPNVSKGSAPGAVTCQLSGTSGNVTISGTITGNPV